MAFESSQGTTFTFNDVAYKCVDIAFEETAPSRERQDMSTLDLDDGDEMVMVDAPLKPAAEPAKFSITYKYEGTKPTKGTEATLTTADGSGTYRCVSSSISRKTNSYVEGTASFEEVIE